MDYKIRYATSRKVDWQGKEQFNSIVEAMYDARHKYIESTTHVPDFFKMNRNTYANLVRSPEIKQVIGTSTWDNLHVFGIEIKIDNRLDDNIIVPIREYDWNYGLDIEKQSMRNFLSMLGSIA